MRACCGYHDRMKKLILLLLLAVMVGLPARAEERAEEGFESKSPGFSENEAPIVPVLLTVLLGVMVVSISVFNPKRSHLD